MVRPLQDWEWTHIMPLYLDKTTVIAHEQNLAILFPPLFYLGVQKLQCSWPDPSQIVSLPINRSAT